MSRTWQRWMTWLYLVILLTNMFFQFARHQGFVKLCRIVPVVLLVSLICRSGNKNKSKITREEQVHDGWQCFLSQAEIVNILVTAPSLLSWQHSCTAQFYRGWIKSMCFSPNSVSIGEIELLYWHLPPVGALSLDALVQNIWSQTSTQNFLNYAHTHTHTHCHVPVKCHFCQ